VRQIKPAQLAFSAHYNIVILAYLLTVCAMKFYTHLSTVTLTLSSPIPLRLYTLSYWSNPPILISDIRALRTERQSARVSKIKTAG